MPAGRPVSIAEGGRAGLQVIGYLMLVNPWRFNSVRVEFQIFHFIDIITE